MAPDVRRGQRGGPSFEPFNADFPRRYWIGMEPAMREPWEARDFGFVLATIAMVALFTGIHVCWSLLQTR